MNNTMHKPLFWKGYWIAAGVLTVLTAAVLVWFWLFIDAYEQSRPQSVIDAFLRDATAGRISAAEGVIPEACDLMVQDEEKARSYIAEQLGTITCLRDAKRSDRDAVVYAVLSDGKRIGSVTMTPEKTDFFGFTRWKITEECYDFSYLMGNTVSVTVPEGYSVYADGVLLDSSYVTQSGIPFAGMADYYDRYTLPTLCTYTVGSVLGTPNLTVANQNGAFVDARQVGAAERSYGNCSEDEIKKLKEFSGVYVERYVRFTSCANGKNYRYPNYWSLAQCMVPDGELSTRMKVAIESLYWVGDQHAKVVALEHNQFIRMAQGVYFCDLTYTVNQKVREGEAESTVNLRLVVVQTKDGLRAETMTIY